MYIAKRLALLALVGALAGSGLRAQESAPADRGAARKRLIERFDKDGNGQLSREERQEAFRAIRERSQSQQRPRGVQVPEGVKVLRDIEYARVDGHALLLDMYLPGTESGLVPVIVWVHGGGWRGGSKDRCPAIPLSGQGYAVASINYRLTDQATFPAQIHDCKAAVRWLRAHAGKYRLDPDRVGAWGASAGGHLVALLGTTGDVKELEGQVGGNLEFSSRVQAVCDFCGPASFLQWDVQRDASAQTRPAESPLTRLLGGPLEENREKARLASPVAHATRNDPPFLIVHGDRDLLVPLKQSELLAAALKQAGVEVTLHVARGAAHALANPERIRMATEFFDRHLKGRRVQAPAASGAAP